MLRTHCLSGARAHQSISLLSASPRNRPPAARWQCAFALRRWVKCGVPPQFIPANYPLPSPQPRITHFTHTLLLKPIMWTVKPNKLISPMHYAIHSFIRPCNTIITVLAVALCLSVRIMGVSVITATALTALTANRTCPNGALYRPLTTDSNVRVSLFHDP